MLTISKPLSAAQIRTYHAEEFSNARDNYYTAGDQIRGRWHGRLARAWGLSGEVQDGHIDRLAEGQHPLTGDVLVQHQATRTYIDRHGERVKTMAHRAGWDATFSAPKSVSLTALVGGDARVTAAHQASVVVALDELERYVQARIGGNQPAETTSQWVAALFEHDSARPVDGYAAPQLHTHVVIFNVTERSNGESRALQPRELYKSQQYATAVYRSELAVRLTALGYALDRGPSGQPEIRGYSPAYLEASSPRRQQITAHLANVPYTSAEAAHIAAHQTREAKIDRSHADMQHHHQQLAAAFGNQPAHVVQAAKARARGDHAAAGCRARRADGPHVREGSQFRTRGGRGRTGAAARRPEAVHGRDDAQRGPHGVPWARRHRGVPGDRRADLRGSARLFTTRDTIALEQATIEYMRAGQHTTAPLAHGMTDDDRQDPCDAVDRTSACRRRADSGEPRSDRGAGGSRGIGQDHGPRRGPSGRTTCGVPRGRAGAHVSGRPATRRRGDAHHYPPTPSGAAGGAHGHGATRCTSSMNRAWRVRVRCTGFFTVLSRTIGSCSWATCANTTPSKRVDPYRQLQRAGLHTVRLDHILRQRDPALKRVVEDLAQGEVRGAIRQLEPIRAACTKSRIATSD